ncbi:MAG: hypothetical protein ABSB01_21300 [Streptosporangiaceae bacterium]
MGQARSPRTRRQDPNRARDRAGTPPPRGYLSSTLPPRPSAAASSFSAVSIFSQSA